MEKTPNNELLVQGRKENVKEQPGKTKVSDADKGLSTANDNCENDYDCVVNKEAIPTAVPGWIGAQGDRYMKFGWLVKYKYKDEWYVCNILNGTSRVEDECVWGVLEDLLAGTPTLVPYKKSGEKQMKTGIVTESVTVVDEHTKVAIELSDTTGKVRETFSMKDIVLYQVDVVEDGKMRIALPEADIE